MCTLRVELRDAIDDRDGCQPECVIECCLARRPYNDGNTEAPELASGDEGFVAHGVDVVEVGDDSGFAWACAIGMSDECDALAALCERRRARNGERCLA